MTSKEIAAYAQSLRHRFAQISECVRDLDAAQLNWRPPFERANSVWVLAEHATGNARVWILGIACGRDLRRDRPGEFASSGNDSKQLLASIEALATEIDNNLRELDPARLDVRLVPARELWGDGPPREISVRDAIVQVIEHASLHLGHMHVTRDLALART